MSALLSVTIDFNVAIWNISVYLRLRSEMGSIGPLLLVPLHLCLYNSISSYMVPALYSLYTIEKLSSQFCSSWYFPHKEANLSKTDHKSVHPIDACFLFDCCLPIECNFDHICFDYDCCDPCKLLFEGKVLDMEYGDLVPDMTPTQPQSCLTLKSLILIVIHIKVQTEPSTHYL